MSTLALNVFLALIWSAGTGDVSLSNLVVGFVLGYFVLRLTRHVMGAERYFTKVSQILRFLVGFHRDLVAANLRVASDVIRPRPRIRPGIVAIRLTAERDEEIILLANVLTLMPGTLSLDVSDDRECLYVHTMHLDDREAFERQIKDGIERRVMELLR